MSQSKAVIRPIEETDEKPIKFSIGKASLEGLATANYAVYLHPLTISVWIALASIMVQIMQWWPRLELGYIEIARPVPAFAAMMVPIMFAVDWVQRQEFEDASQKVLTYPDTANLHRYYSRSPASGLWILELGTTFVGFVAIDGSTDSSKRALQEISGSISSEGTSATAFVRHLYAEEHYRAAGAQQDLLEYAVRATFAASSSVQQIKADSWDVLPYIPEALSGCGFVKDISVSGEQIGLFRWKKLSWSLSRAAWEAR